MVVKGLNNRKNYLSYELLLDAGDFDNFGWSSRNRADTENDSDFLVCGKAESLNLPLHLVIRILYLLNVCDGRYCDSWRWWRVNF